jgi:hypothetical protein
VFILDDLRVEFILRWRNRKGAEVIEYMMWPPFIDKLSPEEDYSFYFEVFGEVSPRIASEYTQVPLPEEDAGLKQCINFAPLYEY